MRILHITNGDSTSDNLRRAGIAGEISTFADVLHAGPVPPDDDMRTWIETRARFLAEAGFDSVDGAREILTRWQSALERHAEYDAVTIWVEHDLFDQLLLIRHLAWFARSARLQGVELVQADDYLGPMTPDRIVDAYARRAQVTAAQANVALRVWEAFASKDHSLLFTRPDTSALPHLANAIARLIDEYPGERSGLGRTDRRILSLLAEQDYTFGELFRAWSAQENPVFMGDATFRWHVQQLAATRVPLVDIGDALCITAAGRDVAGGARNAIELNGIDRWIGGVHLKSR